MKYLIYFLFLLPLFSSAQSKGQYFQDFADGYTEFSLKTDSCEVFPYSITWDFNDYKIGLSGYDREAGWPMLAELDVADKYTMQNQAGSWVLVYETLLGDIRLTYNRETESMSTISISQTNKECAIIQN